MAIKTKPKPSVCFPPLEDPVPPPASLNKKKRSKKKGKRA